MCTLHSLSSALIGAASYLLLFAGLQGNACCRLVGMARYAYGTSTAAKN